jgi:hypothetical protein
MKNKSLFKMEDELKGVNSLEWSLPTNGLDSKANCRCFQCVQNQQQSSLSDILSVRSVRGGKQLMNSA